jgi:hypothetical protein
MRSLRVPAAEDLMVLVDDDIKCSFAGASATAAIPIRS